MMPILVVPTCFAGRTERSTLFFNASIPIIIMINRWIYTVDSVVLTILKIYAIMLVKHAMKSFPIYALMTIILLYVIQH